jgi:3-oxoacyl-[acyl-carrier-protein] synthase III
MRKAGILGFASWFPESIRKNDEWPQAFIDNFESKNIKEEHKVLVDLNAKYAQDAFVISNINAEKNDPFLGTQQRRVAAESVSAVDAETLAAKKVLHKVGMDGHAIDLIFSYSTLPDRVMPSSSNAVAYNINATRAHCIGVDTGCASTLSQIILAKAMIESGLANLVLLIQSHIVLKSWPMMHPASPNVGDCATAILMGPSDHHSIIGDYALSHGEHYTSVTYTRGKDKDLPWWQASDKPFYMGSHDSEKAKELILNTINAGKDTVENAIKKTSYTVKDIDLLISVQPRKWVPGGIASSLGLSEEIAVQTFEKYAHLGPCGIVPNLEEAENSNRLKSGAIVALYAQGAGFCRSSVIIEW